MDGNRSPVVSCTQRLMRSFTTLRKSVSSPGSQIIVSLSNRTARKQHLRLGQDPSGTGLYSHHWLRQRGKGKVEAVGADDLPALKKKMKMSE